MKLLSRILFALLLMVGVVFAGTNFDISTTITDNDGAWSSGVFTTHAGATLSFFCTPSNGTGPYTYSWDFDDNSSYATATTTQNPTHAFNNPGTHYVYVTVTDTDDSSTEKALLVVRVEATSSIPIVDAVTDCSLNDSDSSDNNAALETCIAANYSGGLRVNFTAGTYRFDDATKGAGANERYCGIDARDRNIEFVGVGSASTTLKYYGDTNTGKSWDTFFYMRPSAAGTFRVLISGVTVLLDQDPDNYTVQQLILGDADIATTYITVEDSILQNFSKIGNLKNVDLKRSNITGMGDYGGGNIEMIRPNTGTLAVRNYMTAGDDSHSHFFYASPTYTNFHIVDNYLDGTNQAASKNGIQLKGDCNNYTVSGNLIKTMTSSAIKTGAYDAQAYEADIGDNRAISCANGVMVISSSSNVVIDDNFFNEISGYVLVTGDSEKCATGLDADDIDFTNNIYGENAGTDGTAGGIHNDNYSACGGSPASTVTISGGTDDTTTVKTGDPAGWGDPYSDPGAYVYVIPVMNTAVLSGTGLTVAMTSNGSGMDAGAANARFPFSEGAIVQVGDVSNNYSEVITYSTSSTWDVLTPSTVRVLDVDRNASAPISVSTTSAAITGTADNSTETNIKDGGKTIIITLTNDTWVATVGDNNGITEALITGIDSAQSEGTGWDAEVRGDGTTKMVHGDVVRTSSTVVTITLAAAAAYNITAGEVITVTVPATATTSGLAVTATPTVDIGYEAIGAETITGSYGAGAPSGSYDATGVTVSP